MGKRMTIDEVVVQLSECQRKVAAVYGNIRAINLDTDAGQPLDPDLRHCCLDEAENALRDIFTALKEINNESPWEKGGAA
jgi:hypothetical protein